jgi:hypothetical protein
MNLCQTLRSALAVAAALWAARMLRIANRATNLSFPEKLGRTTDFRREAFVHGAIERGLLQDFPLRMIGREWDVNF